MTAEQLHRLAWVLLTLAAAAPARAERADDYLAGLRSRGWHDTALEYLATPDRLASLAFQQQQGYERATTLSALAQQATSQQEQQQLLEESAAQFQQFAAEQPQSPLGYEALASAGKLHTEQALQAIQQADALPAAASRQREQLQATARERLEEAQKPLTTLLDQCTEQVEQLAQATGQATGQLPNVQGKQAEAQFLLAKLDFEKSRTYPADSKAQQQTLKTAATRFAQIYRQYDGKLVGFYSRLYQGRCQQAIGDWKEALQCYADITDQPPVANLDFQRLVARAVRYRAECHLANQDWERALQECRDFLEESRGDMLSEPDWLAVSYRLATALQKQATSGGDQTSLSKEARQLFRVVAKHPGEFQEAAQTQLVAAESHRSEAIAVDTFEAAFQAGEQALEQMHATQLAAQLAQANNPSAQESLQAQTESQQTLALGYFRQACQLAEEATDPDQLATARYYYCWLLWETGDSEGAAVIGDFLASHSAEHRYAPAAAKIALAAYERLYNAARQAGAPADFESQQLVSAAERLVERWPQAPEAAAALQLLIQVALRDDQLTAAEALVERLPQASRAGAELRLGSALWDRYRQTTGQETPDEAASSLRQKAGQLLASGYQAIQPTATEPTATEAAGILYYAQFLLAQGEAQQAVAVLEHPSAGPLNLIQQSPSLRPALIQETYKVALRAYLSVQPPQRDQAQAMMEALEQAMEGGAGQKKLLRLYASLGLQLQQQMRELTAKGHTDQARAVAASFHDLLTRMTKRVGASGDWQVQKWIAQTNLQIGQGLPDKDAQRYYQQATQAYQALIRQAEADAKFAPSARDLLAVQKQLADCWLAQQQYAQAYDQYLSLLKAKPNLLELQLATAAALQAWGTQQQELSKLEASIQGTEPQANQKNLVWGWLRLATIADQAKRRAEKKPNPAQQAQAKKYQDLFFQARWHAAEARYAAAQLAPAAQRTEQLRSLEQNLRSMQRLYPDLGGPGLQAKTLKLLKQLEQDP